MGISADMEARLRAAFQVNHLEIHDESEAHRGHAGFREGGESHWRIVLHSPDFASQTRLGRHRAVHAALGKDLIGSIHAIALELEAR